MDKKKIIETRSLFLREIRNFFEDLNFLEVSTPLLVENPGLDPHIEMFQTEYLPSKHGLPSPLPKSTFYLPSSPEYHLKKILGFGLPRIFEIAHSFRNGEISLRHEPEFLMLEWYRSPGNYKDIAHDLEKLFKELGPKFAQDSGKYNWGKCEHKTVEELLLQFGAEKPLAEWMNDEDFEVEFERFFVEKVERNLGLKSPCFVWDYPSCFASLSRKKVGAPHLCERFEVYVNGFEIANCYGELTDEIEQRARCVADQTKRKALYGSTPPLDEEFLGALKKLPTEVAGVALGLDRLLQVFLGMAYLQGVLPFPKALPRSTTG